MTFSSAWRNDFPVSNDNFPFVWRSQRVISGSPEVNDDVEAEWGIPRLVGNLSKSSGGGGGAIDPVDHYVHLGVPDLTPANGAANSGVSGLVNIGNGRFEATQSHTAFIEGTIYKVVFDDSGTDANVPEAATYKNGAFTTESERGDIILPAGHWIVCISLNIRSNGVDSNADRQAYALFLTQGNNDRHGQAVYLRNSNFADAVYDNITGVASLAGAVISDGVTPIFAKIAIANQGNNTNTFDVVGAHIHAYQQLV